jgi:hypothetical protein
MTAKLINTKPLRTKDFFSFLARFLLIKSDKPLLAKEFSSPVTLSVLGCLKAILNGLRIYKLLTFANISTSKNRFAELPFSCLNPFGTNCAKGRQKAN